MISEEKLQIAAEKYEKLMLDSLPEPDECEATFSPRFERRIKKLILRIDHPFRYWIQKSVACFLLVVFLGGGGLLTFSTEVRAAFFGWVREVYEAYFAYHYVGEDQDAPEEIIYRPTWVPDGYEISSESHYPGGGTITYKCGNEKIAAFDWSMDIWSSVFRVFPEHAEVKEVFVGTCSADLYIEHGEGLTSAIVWINSEEGAIFMISGTLSEDELMKIAETVEPQNIK